MYQKKNYSIFIITKISYFSIFLVLDNKNVFITIWVATGLIEKNSRWYHTLVIN